MSEASKAVAGAQLTDGDEVVIVENGLDAVVDVEQRAATRLADLEHLLLTLHVHTARLQLVVPKHCQTWCTCTSLHFLNLHITTLFEPAHHYTC